MHKVVGASRALFDTRQWDTWRAYDERIFVGHCRKATVGKVSKATAHPFNYDHITGVHNGTLRNWRYLHDKPEETDSMTMYKAIAERGVRPVIDATDGAYAMVWYDEAEDTLNFLRNKERPLFYCMSKDWERIFWASESWMLSIALAKAGIDMADLTPRDEKNATYILPLEEDTWWRVKVGKRGAKDPVIFLQDHDEALKGGVNPAKYQAAPFHGTYRTPFPVAGSGSAGTPPSGGQSDTTKTQGGSGTTNTSTSGTQATGSGSSTKDTPASRPLLTVVHDSRSGGSGSSNSGSQAASASDAPLRVNGELVVMGYNGVLWTKKEYDAWIEQNCLWCQQIVTFDDLLDDPMAVGDWVDEERFICKACASNDCAAIYGSC